MAKVSFNKLGLKPNNTVATLTFNNTAIEVKYTLPYLEKLELVSNVLSSTIDTNGYWNSMRLHLYLTLEVVAAYTNINFTEKQMEDPFKIYDLVTSSGLFDEIVKLISPQDWKEINENTYKMVNNIYGYKNSVLGILEAVSSDYSNLDLDINKLTAQLGAPTEGLALVKDIMDKLG